MKDKLAEDFKRHLIAHEKTEAIVSKILSNGVCFVDKDYRVVLQPNPRAKYRISLGPAPRYQLSVEEMIPLEGEPGK